MISTLYMVLMYLHAKATETTHFQMAKIEGTVARDLVRRVNRKFKYNLPYPMQAGDEYLLPSGAKVGRSIKQNWLPGAYYIKTYNNDGFKRLCDELF